MRGRVRFEDVFCLGCGMSKLDLRAPTALVISLHGASQCNEHSLGFVRVPVYYDPFRHRFLCVACSKSTCKKSCSVYCTSEAVDMYVMDELEVLCSEPC